MKHGIEELLTFRTEERDRFEAECHRLRRERDNAREEMQWLAVLTAIDGMSTITILYESILRPLWPDAPCPSVPFLAAIRANIKRAHCEHPDSAMDIKSDPVATLVCNDCKAEVVATGVMTRLLEEQKNAPQVARIFVNGVQIATFQDGEFTDTGTPVDPIAELRRVETPLDLARTFGTPGALAIPVTPAPESACEGVAPNVTHADDCRCVDCMQEATLEGCSCHTCIDCRPF